VSPAHRHGPQLQAQGALVRIAVLRHGAQRPIFLIRTSHPHPTAAAAAAADSEPRSRSRSRRLALRRKSESRAVDRGPPCRLPASGTPAAAARYTTQLQLALGNRGQVKRRVHARTHARAPPPPRPPRSPPPPPGEKRGFAPRAQDLPFTSTSSDGAHFFNPFLSISGFVRGSLTELELGDLEAVASPRGSPQLGGQTPTFSRNRFLY
jgi:hypothetical protein